MSIAHVITDALDGGLWRLPSHAIENQPGRNHMSLKGKGVAIVTGASSGIGLACSEAFLGAGFDVVGLARDFSKTDLAHPNFRKECLDLSRSDEIQRAFPPLLKSLTQPLKILVSNAGIGKMGYLEQLSAADIEKVLATNLLGHILVTKHCLPIMKQNHACSDLIFIGSESARQGGKEGSVYCASKFGLRGFAQSLRSECAKAGVRVNLINPGAVRSAFFDNLHFEPGPEAEHAILPTDVAAIALGVVKMRAGTVLDEINMSPLTKVWQSK